MRALSLPQRVIDSTENVSLFSNLMKKLANATTDREMAIFLNHCRLTMNILELACPKLVFFSIVTFVCHQPSKKRVLWLFSV